jgi:hypothetical protein
MKTFKFRKVQFEMTPTGYGQYRLSGMYRGKRFAVHCTDSTIYDRCDGEGEKGNSARRGAYLTMKSSLY